MKYIAKMMLALLASVALVIPAYAWDFSASGSMSAKFEQLTEKDNASATATTAANFSSASGGISLKSSHTDGDKTLGLTYSVDVDTDGDTLGTDTGLDQTLSLAGSVKVGKWTASATASHSLMEDGSYAKVAADDDGAITLTDGSITYKLGDAAHLSTAEKVADTTADGSSEADAEARVDGFNGFSVGLGAGPGTLTIALDMHSGTTASALGEDWGASFDAATACGSGTTAYGVNFSGNVGVDLSATLGMGSSSASAKTCTGNNSSNTFASSTMGIGVGVPMGAMTLGIDFESTTVTGKAGGADIDKLVKGGTQVSVAMGGIADGTVTAAFASVSSTTGSGEAEARTGLEAGWKTTVGAASLEVAYGSWTDNDAAGGDSSSDIEVEMSLSF